MPSIVRFRMRPAISNRCRRRWNAGGIELRTISAGLCLPEIAQQHCRNRPAGHYDFWNNQTGSHVVIKAIRLPEDAPIPSKLLPEIRIDKQANGYRLCRQQRPDCPRGYG